MARSLVEVQEALVSVRAAITAAETAQSYGTGLGNTKTMANLSTLYERERELLAEESALATFPGTSYSGMVRNVGRAAR